MPIRQRLAVDDRLLPSLEDMKFAFSDAEFTRTARERANKASRALVEALQDATTQG